MIRESFAAVLTTFKVWSLRRGVTLACTRHRAPRSDFTVGPALSSRSDRRSPEVSLPKFPHECTDSL